MRYFKSANPNIRNMIKIHLPEAALLLCAAGLSLAVSVKAELLKCENGIFSVIETERPIESIIARAGSKDDFSVEVKAAPFAGIDSYLGTMTSDFIPVDKFSCRVNLGLALRFGGR